MQQLGKYVQIDDPETCNLLDFVCQLRSYLDPRTNGKWVQIFCFIYDLDPNRWKKNNGKIIAPQEAQKRPKGPWNMC